ncbi:MAG: hypothetical protein ACYCV7_11230 [Acidimicrobiales bacterium]
MRRWPVMLALVLSCIPLAACAHSHGTPTRPVAETSHATTSTLAGGGNPGTAARVVLTQYLSSIAAHDAPKMVASSTGPAAALGSVLLDVVAINSAKGAPTTTAVQKEGFHVVAATSTAVTLDGAAVLSSTVRGAKGSSQTTDTVSGPVTVVLYSGRWKVSALTFDGQHMTEWTENTGQTVKGVHVQVGFVLSYASTTVALIGLTAPSGGFHLSLTQAKLSSSTGVLTGVGDFTSPPAPVGLLRFPRSDAQPTDLRLGFSDGSSSLVFDVALHGTAG